MENKESKKTLNHISSSDTTFAKRNFKLVGKIFLSMSKATLKIYDEQGKHFGNCLSKDIAELLIGKRESVKISLYVTQKELSKISLELQQ